MKKLYFANTNADTMTIAVDEETGRACYMHRTGNEGENYPNMQTIWYGEPEEIEQECRKWLETVREWNTFDTLYSDCECCADYAGVLDASEVFDGCEILAEIEF